MKRVLALLGVLLPAIARAQGNNEFAVERAAEPPRIDGVLDDAVWSRAPLAIPADGWVSYQPVRGDKMSVDFRRVYATILDQWLALPAKVALGGDFEPLPLFRG